jgi:Helix-turn-helix domain
VSTVESLPDLMTTAEVAEFIRASKQSLDQDRYLNRGLPYVRIGRKIRYRREHVLKYLDANTFRGDGAP